MDVKPSPKSQRNDSLSSLGSEVWLLMKLTGSSTMTSIGYTSTMMIGGLLGVTSTVFTTRSSGSAL